jgi:hypothetical protein
MRRRNLVVWSQSAGPADRHGFPRRMSAGRIRRRLRIAFLVTIVALWPAIRAVRARWRPLLAGAVLTTVGVITRGSMICTVVLLPGLLLLLTAPLFPGSGQAGQHTELERELAGYWTTAQRQDLEATLDQYPDDVTREVREILAGQAAAAGYDQRVPGLSRY